MASSALDALHARLKARANAVTDADAQAEAFFALETWYGAATCYANAAPRGPTQYSVSGRSFAFASKDDARRAMELARSDFEAAISSHGGTTMVDMGGYL